jgi:hypothetical protein
MTRRQQQIVLLPYVFVLSYTCTNLTVVLLSSKLTLSLLTPLRHGKSRELPALILNVGTSQRRVVNFAPWLLYHRVGTLVPIRYEVRLALELILIIRRREKCFDPGRS